MERRGRWERTSSAENRRSRRRHDILRATLTARTEKGRGATVEDVTSLAGIGRNTFYELFDDLDAAVDAAGDETSAKIEQEIASAVLGAHTPIDRLRRLTDAWLRAAAAEADFVLAFVALSSTVGDRLEAAVRNRLVDVLGAARAAGLVGRAPDQIRLVAAVGAFRAVAIEIARSGRTDATRDAEVLADLTLRILR